MPKLTLVPKEQKAIQKGVAQEVVDEYKSFIEDIDKAKDQDGILEFSKDENMALGRRALQEAGIQMKKYVKVQKVRKEDNKLKVTRITKKEYDEAREVAEARGAKLRGKRRAKK